MVWEIEVFTARIANQAGRLRHEAGSPSPEEIEVYRGALPAECVERCLVLGMTPELRALMARRCAEMVSVDSSAAAIAQYGPWVVSPREKIVQAEWSWFLEQSGERFDVIAGDGVFGNLSGRDAAGQLLQLIHERLAPGGVFVTRMALVPESFEAMRWEWATLAEQFRAGQIGAAEFGLTLRLFGFFRRFYDVESAILDCAGVYQQIASLCDSGALSMQEREIAWCYVFTGKNWLPRETVWEGMLAENAWQVARRSLRGRLWHGYYPFYVCSKA
ncbi:MAG: class I SAM-dependent methyltransferase [Thiobacillaceae bacterium]|jgi:hypothetical protein|nr:class I SAM-dependent methyltransferase [Thiobacillaceae bacterium]